MNYDEIPILEFPQLNEYAIEKIASYLKTTDLKKLRLVDKIWSFGSTVELRRRFCRPFLLKLGGKRKHQLQTFKDDTKNLQPLNFIKIDLRDWYDGSISYSQKEAEDEQLNDVISWLSPNLEILEFTLDCSKAQFNLRTSIFFPLLVKIVINNWYLEGERARQFYPHLYKVAPNLEDLGIVCLRSAESTEFILNPLLKDENGGKIRNWDLLPKLNSLRILAFGSITGFRILSKFPQTFTQLDFSFRFLWYDLEVKAFLEQMFEVNKNTLKSLMLRKYYGNGYNVELKIPNFPKLINLEIEFENLEFKMSFEGKGRKLEYGKTFPVLKRLAIDFEFYDREGLKNLWETFFPKQVCKSLERFELNLETLFLYYLEGEGIHRFWYKELFPNLKL